MIWVLIASWPMPMAVEPASKVPLALLQEGLSQDQRPPAAESSGLPAASAADVPTAREQELLDRIARLEEELHLERSRAMARQEEWIEYVRVLQRFEVPALPKVPDFMAEALQPERDPANEARRRQHAHRMVRSHEIRQSLRSLLIADGVRTLDFLEVGLVDEHQGSTATGPVVSRILDDRGRLTGMLRADRLRIEVSRAARTVTLVLEDGFEMSGGHKSLFPGSDGAGAGGVRRITLPAIDPMPWIEALPDLVDTSDLAVSFDDGAWDSMIVRSRLNRLLASSSPAGGNSWKLLALSGVSKNRLNDVQFIEAGPDGSIRRRVFADEAEIHVPRGAESVRIELASGSVKRGNRVAPFLGGLYRISLPFAKVEDWRAAEIPKRR